MVTTVTATTTQTQMISAAEEKGVTAVVSSESTFVEDDVNASAGIVTVFAQAAAISQNETVTESSTQTESTTTSETKQAKTEVLYGELSVPVAGSAAIAASYTVASVEQTTSADNFVGDSEDVNSEQTTEETVVTEVVSETLEVEETTETMSEEEQAWQNKCITTVSESLNVRSSADENSELVGKLYAGAAADVVEQGDEWTHITSGSVDGYVKNEYCLFGSEAYQYALEHCDTVATTVTGGLRVRSEASEEASVLTSLEEGATATVNSDVEATDGWVAVCYGDKTGYVSAQYVSLSLDVKEGVTLAEEQAAQEAEAAKKAAESASSSSSTTTEQKSSVSASADDVTLLGALIQCEAGNECYEGQVAVGAVVVNRLRSGAYGSSIYSVIYASGQFTPAGSGQVASVVASGVKGSCLQAAQEALNGSDNTGGATCFRNVSSGHSGVVIGNHVFW